MQDSRLWSCCVSAADREAAFPYLQPPRRKAPASSRAEMRRARCGRPRTANGLSSPPAPRHLRSVRAARDSDRGAPETRLPHRQIGRRFRAAASRMTTASKTRTWSRQAIRPARPDVAYRLPDRGRSEFKSVPRRGNRRQLLLGRSRCKASNAAIRSFAPSFPANSAQNPGFAPDVLSATMLSGATASLKFGK